MATFLVEDEPPIRESLIAMMSSVLDATIVGTAETEADAVRWLHSHQGQWHLAVVDLFLKEGTGFGILSMLTKNRKGCVVVVLTNSATAANRSECLRLGADAVFDKSREVEQFLDYCMAADPSACH